MNAAEIVASVARIERQRNPGFSPRLVPDFVSLNPGYACCGALGDVEEFDPDDTAFVAAVDDDASVPPALTLIGRSVSLR
jgi:hypothetical protein